MSEPSRPRQAIAGDLGVLGIGPGDTLMVHASLRSLGPVEGGADGVLDAICEAVGPTGTILMTLGARDEWAWVNDRPESERSALLRNAEPFDPLRTPADPDVGVLAEVFRSRPGTLVSDHPEARFAAAGRLAGELTSDVPWNDYYGPGSPLERFIQADGKVVRLGADPNTVTVLHHAEYLTQLPDKPRVRRHRLVAGPEGPEIRVVECLDDTDGIADYPAEDYFTAILRAYLATGRAAHGIVGDATSELIEAADLVQFGSDWMARNLG